MRSGLQLAQKVFVSSFMKVKMSPPRDSGAQHLPLTPRLAGRGASRQGPCFDSGGVTVYSDTPIWPAPGEDLVESTDGCSSHSLIQMQRQ